MNLGRQWSERLKIWKDYLPRLFYTSLATVPAEYATTMEHLTLEQAQKLPMKRVPQGMKWGKKWEYGWFHWTIKVPRNAAGKLLVFHPGCGGESLVFVNGQARGAQDKKHKYLLLASNAEAGTVYDIYAECYAGHGIRPENGGPYGPDEVPVPEPSEQQLVTDDFSWGIWNDDVYQAAIDYDVLYDMLPVLTPTSLRYQKVAQALQDFTLIADFELEEPERTQSIVEADQKLKPALACHNGSTAPLMSLIGQSHLDLAWLWPLEETKRKCARTYSNQLSLMEEFPEYRFLACEPYIFETLQRYYPEVFERVCQKALSGQFIGDGAFWVESDTNMPSGEALIRQLVRGRRWFKKHFNSESRMAWLPDTFGFSGSLPQIFAGCGVHYFSTQKMLRCDPECDQFPYNNFIWKGIDGTPIVSHIHKKNNAVITSQALWQRWNQDRFQQEHIDGMIFPFGYGDGGGGPTRMMLETVRRVGDLEGIPRAQYEAPQLFFERIQKQLEALGANAPTYTGEMYLSWHRGSYTSQAEIKRGSRKTEVALHDADYADALLSFMRGVDPGRQTELYDYWSALLLNQFHDIMAGTCIQRVHDEAKAAFAQTISKTQALTHSTLQQLYGVSDGGTATSTTTADTQYLVVNTLAQDRSVLVPHPKSGELIEITVPACGAAVLPQTSASETPDQKAGVSCTMINQNGESFLRIENAYMVVIFDTYGRISSLYDTTLHLELTQAPCNEFRMFKDVTPFYDAWELSPMYHNMPLALTEPAEITVVATHKRYVRIKIVRKLHRSVVEQIVTVRADSRRIDFDTTVDWHEKHTFLKVAFPLAIHTEEAYSETQYGYVKRPTHTSRQYDKDRYEVCNQRYTALCDSSHGVAVLNDCKYGVSVHHNVIGLSLLKSAVIPDMRADEGKHQMLYSLYVFDTSFTDSGIVQQAADCNVPVQVVPVPKSVSLDVNAKSFFAIDGKTVVIDSIKTADDDSGDIIMRVYEAYGGYTTAKITTALPVSGVSGTNMLEDTKTETYTLQDGSIEVTFKPFEIKTIRWEK